MDDSMNSVDNTSAMDFSPASSPTTSLNPISSNNLLVNTFQQQQGLLSNILFTTPKISDYQSTHKKAIPDEYDSRLKDFPLFSTTFTNNNHDDSKFQNIPEETNQIRQRIVTEPVSEPVPFTEKSELKSSKQSFNKSLCLIPILIFTTYLIVQYLNPSNIRPRSTNWQNASEYLTKNLIGQEQGLEQFKNAIEKHKNFSVVLIEGPTGTGKSYLASSIEKFIPTTLISTNTLLGLSPLYWTESNRLASYFLSHLSPSLFQFLIIDDLDLLTINETYCQTLTTTLQLINKNKNLFILLLQTGPIGNLCKDNLLNLITTSIQFNMLKRDHIKICIQNEAYVQNVQPTFNHQQIENILNLLKYTNNQGMLYSTTGCKQIPSLVMIESRKQISVDN